MNKKTIVIIDANLEDRVINEKIEKTFKEKEKTTEIYIINSQECYDLFSRAFKSDDKTFVIIGNIRDIASGDDIKNKFWFSNKIIGDSAFYSNYNIEIYVAKILNQIKFKK